MVWMFTLKCSEGSYVDSTTNLEAPFENIMTAKAQKDNGISKETWRI